PGSTGRPGASDFPRQTISAAVMVTCTWRIAVNAASAPRTWCSSTEINSGSDPFRGELSVTDKVVQLTECTIETDGCARPVLWSRAFRQGKRFRQFLSNPALNVCPVEMAVHSTETFNPNTASA